MTSRSDVAGKFIVSKAIPGKVIRVGQEEITPMVRSLRVRFPGFHGGMTWDRPEAVVVVGTDGVKRVLPILDVTRWIQITLLGAGLIGGWMVWRIFGRRRTTT